MTAIKDKGIEVNLRDALLEAKESIEGKRKLNTLDNLINELQKAAKEAPSQLANKEWNILKSQFATSNSPEDKAFSDPDCKKSLGNIGLISEHSEYFEIFL